MLVGKEPATYVVSRDACNYSSAFYQLFTPMDLHVPVKPPR